MKILAKWKDLTVKLDSPQEEISFSELISKLNKAKGSAILIDLALRKPNEYVPNLEHVIGRELIVIGIAATGKVKKSQIPSIEDKPKKTKKKKESKPKYLYPLDAKSL
jgi:hypothetical protein